MSRDESFSYDVLGRHYDLGGLDRLACFVTDRHRALGVPPACKALVAAPGLRDQFESAMNITHWRWHKRRQSYNCKHHNCKNY
jgi:hypothetical protein